MKYLLLGACLTLTMTAHATSWGSKEKVDDPIMDGQSCKVQNVRTFGSYIFRWPSKYDQVFWPQTDERSIWYCKKSGYVAFVDNFKVPNENEREEIRKYLKEHGRRVHGIEGKLERLEALYNLRNLSAAEQNRLIRILARWNQKLGHLDKADQYRHKALDGIVTMLGTQMPDVQRMTYLYIAANYTRQFGDAEASDKYLTRLSSLLASTDQEENKGAISYFKKLMAETPYITMGGAIDPVLPDDGKKGS